MNSRGLVVAQLLFLVVIAGALLADRSGRDDALVVDRLYEHYTAAGAFDATFEDEVLEIAAMLVNGTRYSGRVRVNAPRKPGLLSIWLVDPPEAGPLVRHVRLNCLAFPAEEVVVVDTTLLDACPAAIPLVVSDDDPVLPSILRTWLVGHEIGHVVLGHGERNAFFGFDATDEGPGGLDLDAHPGFEAEREADAFVVSHLEPSPSQSVQYFQQLIDLFYDLERGHEVGPGDPPLLRVPVVSASHPPFLVRLTHFFDAIEERYTTVQFPWSHAGEARLEPYAADGGRVQRALFYGGVYVRPRERDAGRDRLSACARTVLAAELGGSLQLQHHDELDEPARAALAATRGEILDAHSAGLDPWAGSSVNPLHLAVDMLLHLPARDPDQVLVTRVFMERFGQLLQRDEQQMSAFCYLLLRVLIAQEQPEVGDASRVLWLLEDVLVAFHRSGYVEPLLEAALPAWAGRFEAPVRAELFNRLAEWSRSNGWPERELESLVRLREAELDLPDGSPLLGVATHFRLARIRFEAGDGLDAILRDLAAAESIVEDVLPSVETEGDQVALWSWLHECRNSRVYYTNLCGSPEQAYDLGAAAYAGWMLEAPSAVPPAKLLISTMAAGVAAGIEPNADLLDESLSLLAQRAERAGDDIAERFDITNGLLTLAAARWLRGEFEQATTLAKLYLEGSPVDPVTELRIKAAGRLTQVADRLVPVVDILDGVPFEAERYEPVSARRSDGPRVRNFVTGG